MKIEVEQNGVKITLDKPVRDGWNFKEYQPVMYGEDYYNETSGGEILRYLHSETSLQSYFIATKVEPESPKARGIERCAIEEHPSTGVLCFYRGDLYVGVGSAVDDPTFKGFEDKDGCMCPLPIWYWNNVTKIISLWATAADIESGIVKVHHAKYVMFWKECE